MTAPVLTLKEVREKAQAKQARVSRVSDFLTNDEKEERLKTRAKSAGKGSNRLYDAVDAFVAEIIARFGYDAYRAWRFKGEFTTEDMSRMLFAERAREKRLLAPLEAIIISSVAGANQPTKGRQAPKSLKNAIKILKDEQKRGAENG